MTLIQNQADQAHPALAMEHPLFVTIFTGKWVFIAHNKHWTGPMKAGDIIHHRITNITRLTSLHEDAVPFK